jgi:LysM repeat protein
MLDGISGSALQGLNTNVTLLDSAQSFGASALLDAARIGTTAFDVYKISEQLNSIAAHDPAMSAALRSEVMTSLSTVEQAQLQAAQAKPKVVLSPTPAEFSNPYKVKQGDTIESLCVKFGITQFEFLQANPKKYGVDSGGYIVLDPNAKTLNIPQGNGAIVMQPGQKLADVAQKYGVPEAHILRVNGYTKASDIPAGARLIIVPKSETGLDKDANVISFINDMKALAKPNPKSDDGKWSLNDKEKFLEATVNKKLKSLGIPPLDIKFANLPAGQTASYELNKHQIIIDKKYLSADMSKPENLEELCKTVYHETRHAEQNFNIVRAVAGSMNGSEKDKINAIQKASGIDKDFVKAAVKVPLDPKSDEGKYFLAMYESVYGKDAAATEAIYEASTDGDVTEADFAANRALPMELDAARVDAKISIYF